MQKLFSYCNYIQVILCNFLILDQLENYLKIMGNNSIKFNKKKFNKINLEKPNHHVEIDEDVIYCKDKNG